MTERIMTLTGPPKSGKTREALRLAAGKGETVLYYCPEDRPEYLFRLLDGLRGENVGLFHFSNGDWEETARLLEPLKVRFLVFDHRDLPQDLPALVERLGIGVLHVQQINLKEWREIGSPRGWKYR